MQEGQKKTQKIMNKIRIEFLNQNKTMKLHMYIYKQVELVEEISKEKKMITQIKKATEESPHLVNGVVVS